MSQCYSSLEDDDNTKEKVRVGRALEKESPRKPGGRS